MNMEMNEPLQEPIAEGTPKKAGRRSSGERDPRGGGSRWVFVLIDILLLAAIVAAVLFVVSLITPFSFGKSGDTEKRTITYTVELARVDSAAVDAFHIGDRVTDAQTGATLGTVTAVDVGVCEEYRTDAVATTQDATLGTYVMPKVTYTDSYKTVVLTVTVTADYEAGVGYTADGCRIAVERAYDLHLPAYAGQGVCLALSE